MSHFILHFLARGSVFFVVVVFVVCVCVFFNRLAACLRLFSVVYMVLFADSLVSHQPVIFQPGIKVHPTPLHSCLLNSPY